MKQTGKMKTDRYSTTILNSLPFGIVFIDNEYNILFQNRAFCHFFNTNNINSIEKTHIDELSKREFLKSTVSQNSQDIETENFFLENHEYRIDFTSIHLYDGSLGFIGIVNNNSENMNSNRKTDTSVNCEYICFRNIGHELNNFLTVIQLRSEILKINISDKDKITKIIGQLYFDINALNRYANNLLYLGKPREKSILSHNLIQFIKNLSFSPETLRLIGSRTVSIKSDLSDIYITANTDMMNTLFINAIYLAILVAPETQEINLEIIKSDPIVKVFAFYHKETFPINEFYDLEKFRDLKKIKLSSKNITLACIVFPAVGLGWKIAAEEKEEYIQLVLEIPVFVHDTHETITKHTINE